MLAEAAYFHEAYRRQFGDELAGRFTTTEFVHAPIAELLRGLSASLDAVWDNLNPVAALHLLNALQQDNDKPTIEVVRLDNVRISNQGGATDFESVEPELVLASGTEYFLCITPADPSHTVLVLEYCEEPVRLPSGKLIQAQILQHQQREGDQILVTGVDGRPLQIADIEGRFGFVAAHGVLNQDWQHFISETLPPSKSR